MMGEISFSYQRGCAVQTVIVRPTSALQSASVDCVLWNMSNIFNYEMVIIKHFAYSQLSLKNTYLQSKMLSLDDCLNES